MKDCRMDGDNLMPRLLGQRHSRVASIRTAERPAGSSRAFNYLYLILLRESDLVRKLCRESLLVAFGRNHYQTAPGISVTTVARYPGPDFLASPPRLNRRMSKCMD